MSSKELGWLLPFIGLGFLLLSLARSVHFFPPPTQGRVVVDVRGREVIIPVNFKGIIPMHDLADFLQKTHAPEKLAKAGPPEGQANFIFSHWQRSLMDWFFPMVARDDSLWDFPSDLESILAHHQEGYVYLNDSFWLSRSNIGDIQRRFGMTAVGLWPLSFDGLSNDDVIVMKTKVLNDTIGQKENAEVYLADFFQDMADLVEELDLETAVIRPSVLAVGSSSEDWSHLHASDSFDERLGLGAVMKGKKALGREQDGERILYTNPDIILHGHPPSFMKDPRWQGLKAVKEKRIYGGIRFSPYPFDLNFQPLGLRHLAELVYPERLKPKLRWMLRNKFEKNYGYRLKDYEIDWLLNLEVNLDSVGYQDRFGMAVQEAGQAVGDISDD